MDFLRAPRNLEFYVVGKLLMCSFSEFIAGITNPRTLRIKKSNCYFTYNCKSCVLKGSLYLLHFAGRVLVLLQCRVLT